MPFARLIEKVLPVVVNFLDVLLYLVIKEAKFCGSFNRRGGIYLDGKLLCSIAMDEANSSRLWGKIQGNSSPM
jgi:hypothetical protein